MKINITCINALGTFQGTFEQEELTHQEAQNTIDALMKNINNLKHLAVRCDDGGEFVFTESIVKSSVFKFLIME